jgi:oxazoline/thiazoline synthase
MLRLQGEVALDPLRFHSYVTVFPSSGSYIALSELGPKFLSGPVLERLVPLLDGSHSLPDIVELLSPACSAEAVTEALAMLTRAGLVGTHKSGSTREIDAFWEFSGVDPGDVKERLCNSDVAVVSWSEATVSGIPEALRALGIEVKAGGCFRLVVARDYTDPALFALNEESLGNNAPWMLTRPFGRTQWIGPVFVPGRTACWNCMATALARNGWHAAAAVANLPTIAAATRTMAATEAAKWLLSGHSAIEGRIRAFDTLTLDMTDHPVIARPECPACHGNGRREVRLGDATLLSPLTGAVYGLEATQAAPGISIVEASASRTLWPDPSGVMYYTNRDRFLGKGSSAAEARAACIGEAAERTSCRFHGNEHLIESVLADLGEAAVDPRALLLYSERQYAARTEWNANTSEAQRIGEPFEPDARIQWVAVKAWTSGRLRYVPAGFCYLGHEVPFCGADTNGCASGDSFEAAVLAGLLELVERDAVAVWWYNRICRPGVEAELQRLPRISVLTETLEGMGWRCYLLDLTTDLQIPVCAAVGSKSSSGRFVFGSAAGIDMEHAARGALLELGASCLTDDIGVRLDVEPWLFPSIEDHESPTSAATEPAHALDECVEQVERCGLEVLVLDITRPELGIPAVRVLAPGLRPWVARFAPGRLYDTPVALGWLARPLSEVELNPIPFPPEFEIPRTRVEAF